MRVEFKVGYPARIKAEVAHKAIEEIRKANGGDIDPERIVAAAKPKRSALHPVFEWDDSAAAHEYRLEQARGLVRAIHVIRDDVKSESPQRVYEAVRIPRTEETEPRKAYRTVEDVMADPETRAELLSRAMRELLSFRKRHHQLQELAIVIRSIDEVLETADV